VAATGTVNPVLTIIVGSYVSGVIQNLYCDFNTEVKAGQVCATLDPAPYQSLVDQSQADLMSAQAQLNKDQATADYAQASYRRAQDLSQGGFISADALEASRSTAVQTQALVEVDKALIAQRSAALRTASINLRYTRITSPVDGTVVARNVTIGQTVAASFQTPTLFLIAKDLTQMQVDANVSETDIGQLALNQPVRFTVEAYPDRQFLGTVTQIRQAPQTVQNVVTYDVVIGVDNRDHKLVPGMTATLRIITAQHDHVLRIPDEALRYLPTAVRAATPSAGASGTGVGPVASRRVWILRDGAPQAISLSTGLDDDSYSEVIGGGLQVGDRIIAGEVSGSGGSSTPAVPRFGL